MLDILRTLCEKSTQRVEKGDPFCYWQVDDYKLDNKHLVMWYEKEHKKTANFVYRDLSYLRTILKNTEIDMDHDYHLDFLKYLRSKYSDLKLMYSGGTDSATILDLAYRNNIPIDETITWAIEDIELPSNIEQKNIALPGIEAYGEIIKKSTLIVYTHKDIEKYFSNPYSFFSGPCDTSMPATFAAAKYTAMKKYTNRSDTCIISGIDKPKLIYYNGRWYAHCLDHNVAWGDQSIPNLVPFYLDARNIKGYVKDCLLFKNYILNKNIVTEDFLQFFQPGKNTEDSKAIGRLKIQGVEHQFQNESKSNNEKNQKRFKECFGLNHFTPLIKYFKTLETFYDVFPETKTNHGLEDYNNNGKFAWFIDIDSLEVLTQYELIPNGFEKSQ